MRVPDFTGVTNGGIALQVCELGEDAFNKKFSVKWSQVVDTFT
jgi:hypothetical protein